MKKLPTDVRHVGDFTVDGFASGARPTRPGFAVGGDLVGSGTIGCAVKDKNGQLLGLTCGHVFSGDGNPSIGAHVLVPDIAQANTHSVLNPKFGTIVSVGSVGVAPGDEVSNLDAATFVPDNPNWLVRELAFFNHAPNGIMTSPDQGLSVFKVGATTEFTTGTVQGAHLTIFDVPYSTGSATFIDQIGISSFTREGDSGALVLADNGEAIGLHVGSSSGMSFCTPIQTVLERLKVTLA